MAQKIYNSILDYYSQPVTITDNLFNTMLLSTQIFCQVKDGREKIK